MKRAAQGWGTEVELYLAHTKPEAGSPGGWEPTEEDEPVRSKGQKIQTHLKWSLAYKKTGQCC